MIVRLIAWGLALTSLNCFAQPHPKFSYAEPESKGYSSEKLEVLANHLEVSGSSSMLVMVDGEIIFEWGDTSKKHLIHSMRKAMLNSLYGIAIGRGQIDTTMTLRELNINDIEPALSEAELDARVADLLKSRSGIYHNAAAVNNAMLIDRPERGTHAPGEHYYYNNWDFNALGAILEQQTGENIYTMFNEEIAQPLGMLDYEGRYVKLDAEAEEVEMPDTDGYYKYENSLSQHPAYHFRMSARDLALYGQLYLNYGVWEGQQIIPKDWIDVSTQPYSVYSPQYGNAYGMLWRVRVPGENTQRNSFFHTGVGIHMLGIYPDSGLVMVHRVDTEHDTSYNEGDFYKMIGLLSNSRL
ncbi:MAG TPA: amide hydrolase [Cytophagales bacterium]|nr:amide hydrolase [Cytophagales bacterium]HAP59907.1 amide hydrolase [Cytophagales bacterium]